MLGSFREKWATEFEFSTIRGISLPVCGLRIIYDAPLAEITEHAEELESGRLMVTVEPR